MDDLKTHRVGNDKRGYFIFNDGSVQECDIDNLIELFGEQWACFIIDYTGIRPTLADDMCKHFSLDQIRAAVLSDHRWRVDVNGVQFRLDDDAHGITHEIPDWLKNQEEE